MTARPTFGERTHPFVVFGMIGEVPGLDRTERRAVALDAVRRSRETAANLLHPVPDRLTPPGATARRTLAVQLLPTVILLAVFFWVVRQAPPIGTAVGVVVRVTALVVMIAIGWAAQAFTSRGLVAPMAWAVLRERGVDACLHCGWVGMGSGDERTRCTECGATNPPSPRSQADTS